MDCTSAKCSNWSVARMFDSIFYWWGCTVALNPWKIILSTLLVTALTSHGLHYFSTETDGWEMWLPEGSRHSLIKNWKEKHFAENIRGTITIFRHKENVLSREGLLLLLDLHQKVHSVQFNGGNFTKACMKIPVTNILLPSKKRKKQEVFKKWKSRNALSVKPLHWLVGQW